VRLSGLKMNWQARRVGDSQCSSSYHCWSSCAMLCYAVVLPCQVLLLDADSMPLVDPNLLFKVPLFQ